MRKPLGLVFDPEDLKLESEEFHIAAFDGKQMLGILLLKKATENHIIKMRQVAVADGYQGKRIGKQMIGFAENFARLKTYTRMELHARETAVPFYLKNGYTVVGERFTEVGIPHFKMFKNL